VIVPRRGQAKEIGSPTDAPAWLERECFPRSMYEEGTMIRNLELRRGEVVTEGSP